MNNKFLVAGTLLAGLFLWGGCTPTMPEGWTYRSEKEIRAFEAISQDAYVNFKEGKYKESEKILEGLVKYQNPLKKKEVKTPDNASKKELGQNVKQKKENDYIAQELNVSTPLYLAELAVTKIALGKREEAKIILKEVRKLWDEARIESSEDKAASVFSAEFNKLFKGESYEYSTLYMIVGLFYLEEGDVDNALACFKNGLLRDADVSSDLYSSDYAMLLWLEALCYDLRGEKAKALASRNMVAVALFESVPENLSGLRADRQKIVAAYLNTKRMEKMRRMIQTKEHKDVEKEILESIASLEKETAALMKDVPDIQDQFAKLDKGGLYDELLTLPSYAMLKEPHNLVILWTGTGPSLTLAGDYKELREVHKGSNIGNLFFVVPENNNNKDIVSRIGCDFGDVSYQAVTRGPREFDLTLQKKANTKKTTHNISTGLVIAGSATIFAAQFVSDSNVKLGMTIGGGSAILLGIIGHGIAAAMTPEADARHWKNVPNMFLTFSVPTKWINNNSKLKLLCFSDSVLVSVHDLDLTEWKKQTNNDKEINIHQIFLGNPNESVLKKLAERRDIPAQKATKFFINNTTKNSVSFSEANREELNAFTKKWVGKYPKPDNELDGLQNPPPDNATTKAVHSYFLNSFFK